MRKLIRFFGYDFGYNITSKIVYDIIVEPDNEGTTIRFLCFDIFYWRK